MLSEGYIPHIQSRSEEAKALKNTEDFKAYCWVVERTHSWLNRYRRNLIRWEKKIENYEAMLHFACGLIVWNKILSRQALKLQSLNLYYRAGKFYLHTRLVQHIIPS